MDSSVTDGVDQQTGTNTTTHDGRRNTSKEVGVKEEENLKDAKRTLTYQAREKEKDYEMKKTSKNAASEVKKKDGARETPVASTNSMLTDLNGPNRYR